MKPVLHKLTCVAAAGVLATMASSFAMAQDGSAIVAPSQPSNAAPSVPTPAVTPGTVVAASPQIGTAAAVTNTASPAVSTTTTTTTSSATTTPDAMGSVANEPAVAAVMDRLKQDESRISVGDMTSAQDTVARLDLLLQIEKKLGDIDKARQDRAGASMMMPPGMENLPLSGGDSAMTSSSGNSAMMSQMKRMSANNDFSVARIAGRQGKFTATLSTPDGKQITVRPGDTFGDNMKVSSISSAGVQVSSKSGTKTLPLSGS